MVLIELLVSPFMEYTIEELKPFIFGLPWFGKDDYNLFRLPKNCFSQLSEDMQRLCTFPAGGMLRFRAKTDIIVFEMDQVLEEQMQGFSQVGQYALDIYCDGFFIGSIVTAKGHQFPWIQTDGSAEHEYCVYFPTYNTLNLQTVILECHDENAADPKMMTPSDFTTEGSIVVYGSSITHGAFASRTALAYPARLGRIFNAEVINMGFSGAGKGEKIVSDHLAAIPKVSLYLLDWGCNICDPNEVSMIVERYPYMIEKITEAHPGTPILFVSTQVFPDEVKNTQTAKSFSLIREVTRKAYEMAKSKGVECEFIDLRDVMGPNIAEYTVDLVHCNDLGYSRYLESFVPAIKRLFGQ
jgi:lysophospholipase L1-like esterase